MAKRPRGPQLDWAPTTARQKGVLADLVARYQQHYDEDTLPRGPRGIFYDLRPDGMGNGVSYRKPSSHDPISGFDKDTEAHPAAVQEVLVLARRAGMIPEDWVADVRAPEPIGGDGWDDAEERVQAILDDIERAAQFNLDAQRFQPVHIEVLCEAEGLQERLARVAGPYGVQVFSGAGFDGIKGKRAFAERAQERDRATVVLNVGDRDPHGESIYFAAAEDAVAWAEGNGEIHEIGAPFPSGQEPGLLNFYRLALTLEQAEELAVLDVDGKAEAEAIPVQVLDRWLIGAIERLQVPARREQMLELQETERERVPDLIREALEEL